jgi:hypothetical protein
VARRSFLGYLRLALLLAALVFVALGAWLDRTRSTDWDAPLRVTVYAIPAADVERSDLAGLEASDFAATEAFFAEQAREYGIEVDPPFRIRVSYAAPGLPPAPPVAGGPLGIGWWSLRMRYWAWRVAADDPLPPPDIQVFAIYYPDTGATAVPDSLGLSKGLMAVTHLYVGAESGDRNQVVLAHELLHTLGATDKYDPATGQPQAPAGLGDPDQEPRYPQVMGELMAGRVAVSPREAVMPDSLEQMRVGPFTAREIGWVR